MEAQRHPQRNPDPEARHDRHALLRGRFCGAVRVVRPFGALDEADFHETCTGCGDCAMACGEDIIRRDRDGLAMIDPAAGECVFCGDCVAACAAGALALGREWPWRAVPGAGCLHDTGVVCRACEDMCPSRAIGFRPVQGGRLIMRLSQADCSGCMACVGVCPTGAIAMQAVQISPEVSK